MLVVDEGEARVDLGRVPTELEKSSSGSKLEDSTVVKLKLGKDKMDRTTYGGDG